MIQEFVPRTTRPANDNKYYIKTTFGGWNKCIKIQSDGRVLPNCTGYAYGRFMECQLNVHSCNLSRANAELWYSHTIDGYQRGQTPKLGAVICWHSTRSGGHVAIVEEIKDNGDIVTSNSAYSGSYFYMKTLKKSNNYYMGKAYTFQGFIYNPTNFDPVPPTPVPPEESKKKRFLWVLYANRFRKHLR